MNDVLRLIQKRKALNKASQFNNVSSDVFVSECVSRQLRVGSALKLLHVIRYLELFEQKEQNRFFLVVRQREIHIVHGNRWPLTWREASVVYTDSLSFLKRSLTLLSLNIKRRYKSAFKQAALKNNWLLVYPLQGGA